MPVTAAKQVAINLVKASSWQLGDGAGLDTKRLNIDVERITQGMKTCLGGILVIEPPTLGHPPPAAGCLGADRARKNAVPAIGRVADQDDVIPGQTGLCTHEWQERAHLTQLAVH
jgi:hypothetical protein